MKIKNLPKKLILRHVEILDQVLNGVASRMSILYLLLGTKEKVDEK